MDNLAQRLLEIRRKVEVVLSENRALKEENLQLAERLQEAEKRVELQKNTLSELTEQNKLIKLAKNFPATGTDNFEMKIKINELVREIDRCIDLLNE
jgi:regulator of replication initiation timing